VVFLVVRFLVVKDTKERGLQVEEINYLIFRRSMYSCASAGREVPCTISHGSFFQPTNCKYDRILVCRL